MAIWNTKTANAKNFGSQKCSPQQGFAMVGLLAVLPLTLALIGALALTLYAVKKKSLVQALCVRQGLQLQLELSSALSSLLRLNPAAKRLRVRRKSADQAVAIARASSNPKAIAVAQALRSAVILEQLALKAKQDRLLNAAEQMRLRHKRDLHGLLRRLGVSQFRENRGFTRPLAVKPNPIDSLTPEYLLWKSFSRAQRQDFHFQVNLNPKIKIPLIDNYNLQQRGGCSITLKNGGKKWQLAVLAASVAAK